MIRGLLLFLLGALVGANATYYAMTRSAQRAPIAVTTEANETAIPAAAATGNAPPTSAELGNGASPTTSTERPAAPVLPNPVATMHPSVPAPSPATTMPSSPGSLLIPVQGIAASQLSDTFTDARGSGRVHDAIDIMAPAGTPVLAVADGHVEKLFNSKLGGLTLYEFNRVGTLAYYYAHLQRYADGLAEQQAISRGQVIGYVGSTGNASADAPHLHFAIFVLGPEKQWWKGEAINPYPQLRGHPSTP